MPTDHPALGRAPRTSEAEAQDSAPVASLSHLTHVLQRYSGAIIYILAAVAVAYTIIAVAIYVFSPSQRIVSQAFRLDFDGATTGKYPNGEKFSVADIISGPIVTRAFQDNNLNRYLSLGDFTRSVFVLESNREYDALAADYQSKLSDPRLSPVDRERLQRDFELRAKSITKNQYSINFAQASGTTVPDPIARKVVRDILADWADFEVHQQHVITYRIAVLSPAIAVEGETPDLVSSIALLRSKTNEVIANVEKMESLPGGTLARGGTARVSLEEIRLRLDELSRFQLEPLLGSVLRGGTAADRTNAVTFFETQVAHDQRRLDAAQRLADSARDAIVAYEQPSASSGLQANGSAASPAPEKRIVPTTGTETVMPQLTDSFLDRLVSLTSHAEDTDYRQNLVNSYRDNLVATIPLHADLDYDSAMLAEARKPSAGTGIDRASAEAQVAQIRAALSDNIAQMNDVFQVISRNMTASPQLYALAGPPVAGFARSASAQRLALWGVLILLLAFPGAILFAILHNRVREEDAAEAYAHERQFTAT